MITQSMTKLEGHPKTGLFNCCTDQGLLLVSSQCLRLISGAYMLGVNKHARWILLEVNVTNHKCSIGVSIFAYFSYGIAVLGTPQCPPR